jgi:hypothetical protein
VIRVKNLSFVKSQCRYFLDLNWFNFDFTVSGGFSKNVFLLTFSDETTFAQNWHRNYFLFELQTLISFVVRFYRNSDFYCINNLCCFHLCLVFSTWTHVCHLYPHIFSRSKQLQQQNSKKFCLHVSLLFTLFYKRKLLIPIFMSVARNKHNHK